MSSSGAFAASVGMDNFTKNRRYIDKFVDVPRSAWFYQYVKAAYEYGFVSGRSESKYVPDGNITIAETLVIACQLNSIYYNKTLNRSKTNPWYKPYVDYAVSNGIIGSRDYSNYDAIATRAQFAVIMANSLPSSALSSLGSIVPIPDVSSNAKYSNAVYKLYKAGIIAGSDEYGSFKPNSYIKRSEVAVIVLNMADPSRRKLADSLVLSLNTPRYKFMGMTLGEIKKAFGDTYRMVWDGNFQCYFAVFDKLGTDFANYDWPTVYDFIENNMDYWAGIDTDSLVVSGAYIANDSHYRTNAELISGIKVTMTYSDIKKAIGNKVKINSPEYDEGEFWPEGYYLQFKLDGYNVLVYWDRLPSSNQAYYVYFNK